MINTVNLSQANRVFSQTNGTAKYVYGYNNDKLVNVLKKLSYLKMEVQK